MDKSQLLQTVNHNKTQHICAYNESVSDYKELAIKIAKQHLKSARSGDLAQIKKINAMPPAPVSYEKEYDRAIRMLECSVDSVIELDEAEFNRLVLDEWNWKTQFVTACSLYKSM